MFTVCQLRISMLPEESFHKTIRSLQRALVLLAGLIGLVMFSILWLLALTFQGVETTPVHAIVLSTPKATQSIQAEEPLWKAPAESHLITDENAKLIQYGKELITNTSRYLGPKGTVAHMSNGMNCQNCHLDAGTKPWGNNYSAVASTFPKYRERSGTVEGTVKRVNDCFERSLNGTSLDSSSREMKAIVAYINFLGSEVPRGKSPVGSGIWKVPFLDRAADPDKGKLTYQQKCVSCHGATGQGIPNPEGTGYTFPPLWGVHSYNQGAGLFRISRLAGYIKVNMPLGANFENPQLSDEEAWDVAAYIESMPHPPKDRSRDWPRIARKPFDHPFGPYADLFSEQQHKYGPFKPIKTWQDQHKSSIGKL